MSAVWTIAGYGLREALRRKAFAVVLVLTAGFLFLYWLANHYIFRDVENIGPPIGIEPRPFAGATREDAPRIVQELVANGESVYGVRVLSSTLEDVYLDAVQGETA